MITVMKVTQQISRIQLYINSHKIGECISYSTPVRAHMINSTFYQRKTTCFQKSGVDI